MDLLGLDANVILYEDNHLLIINKPAGMLVHGDATGDKTLLDHAKAYLKKEYHKPGSVFLHPVHRLDRPVSGAIMMCRTDKALGRMQSAWRTRSVTKSYVAITESVPKKMSGRLRHFMKKNKRLNKSYIASSTDSGSKEAILEYDCLGIQSKHALLKVQLHTGRPHQIRLQLAHAKMPIIGDHKYGSKADIDNDNILLHSSELSFEHPVKRTAMTITANPPKWWRTIRQINDLVEIASQ